MLPELEKGLKFCCLGLPGKNAGSDQLGIWLISCCKENEAFATVFT
ncbi:acyl-CoA-dehydrogenase, peroxisomal [Nostoc sp. PCC 7107]|nr:acyl-CoA-dehydrogenase, peroxisomal [Nostoc sp. PCC 7107]